MNLEKGVIFDVDGTLWDASAPVTKAWNAALSGHPGVSRRVTEDEIRGLMGKTIADIRRLILPDASEELQKQVAEDCMELELKFVAEGDGVRFFPREAETLRSLAQRYPLFIVSNCRDGYIDTMLRISGFGGLFRDSEWWARTGKLKGENIRLLVSRNRLQKAVYVGDTQLDFDSAAEAGVSFLHAAYGYGRVPAAQHAAASFSEIADLAPRLLDKPEP